MIMNNVKVIHGDTLNAINTAKLVKDSLIMNGFKLKPLNKMSKFGLWLKKF